jgi:phenylalanyl-tRNA synthetase beta chain
MPEHWDTREREVDFFDVKADVESLLKPTGRLAEFRFEAAAHPALRPGRSARITLGGETVGWLGAIHPVLQRRLDLRRPVQLFSLELSAATDAEVPAYRPYSRFPSVRRDLAVIVPIEVSADSLIATVRSAAGDLLQRVTLFDVYTRQGIEPGRKSVALGLILQGVSRTLTDADADRAVHSVTRSLEREHGATIRSQ